MYVKSENLKNRDLFFKKENQKIVDFCCCCYVLKTHFNNKLDFKSYSRSFLPEAPDGPSFELESNMII